MVIDSDPTLFDPPEPTNAWQDIGYSSPADPETTAAGKAALGRPDRTAPKDADGLFKIDEIQPGMLIPGWGVVRGREVRPDDSPYDDIVNAATHITPSLLPLFAARRYAELLNEGDEPRAASWKGWSGEQGWWRPTPRKKSA